MSKKYTLYVVAALLALMLACSSSSDEGGGGNQALGAQMSELSSLGDQFVGENQETYDAVGESAGLISAALSGGGVSAATTGLKQSGCLPEGLAGSTFLIDVQSDTFMPTNPQGPQDAVQFRLLSDSQTEVGYVNVTCAGALPRISVTVSVNTADDVEVLNLVAAGINAFPPSSFDAQLSGTLRSSDGQEEVPFGSFGFSGASSLGISEGSRFASTNFMVGPTVSAFVSQEAFSDFSSPFEQISIVVEDAPDFSGEQFICPSAFSYRADMQGTPGNVNGGGRFCARPPLGDDFNYFVNCNNGSIDDMVVSAADVSCQENAFFEGDATQLPGSVLNDIQAGTDALLGMHNAVISVAEAGGAVALQLAEQAQQQQQF